MATMVRAQIPLLVRSRDLRVYPDPDLPVPDPYPPIGYGLAMHFTGGVGWAYRHRSLTETGTTGITRTEVKFFGYSVSVTCNNESCTVKD